MRPSVVASPAPTGTVAVMLAGGLRWSSAAADCWTSSVGSSSSAIAPDLPDMKLCNNFLPATALARSSEAMVLGVKAGLDPKMMLDVINTGSGRNSATQDKFPRSVLPRTFDFGFGTGLMYKDVRLCMEEPSVWACRCGSDRR